MGHLGQLLDARWMRCFALIILLESVGTISALAAPLTTVGPPAVTGQGPFSVAFSPDGAFLATANINDDSVSMFSVARGGVMTPVSATTATGDGPTSVAFSPSGGLLATANSYGDSVTVFTVSPSGRLNQVAAPSETGHGPFAVAFSPSGGLLVTANAFDGSISVFSVTPGGLLVRVGSPVPTGGGPHSVAFSADGRFLATANTFDGSLSVLSVSANGVLIPVGPPTAAGDGLWSVAFHPGGGLLAAANRDDDTVSMFAISSSGTLSLLGSAPAGDDPLAVAFSADGQLLATTSGAGSASMFTVSNDGTLASTGSAIATGDAPFSAAFSPREGLLAVANQGGNSVSMFSLSARGDLIPVGSTTKTAHAPFSVAFSPVGELVVAANVEVDSLSVFSMSPAGWLNSTGPPVATGDGPVSVAFRPDGRLLVSANTNDDTISVFSVSTGASTAVGAPVPTGDSPQSIAFSPNGNFVATANWGSNTISVFAVSAGGTLAAVGTPVATGRSPYSVAFSPNGKLLATANTGDNSVSLFSVSAGGGLTPSTAPAPTGSAPISVAFSPSGALLATANLGSDSVSVFSVSPSGTIAAIGQTPAGDAPHSVAFSPSGGLLAAAGFDSSDVLLFSVSAGGLLTPVGSPTPTGTRPRSTAFSPDGRFLATANSGATSVSMFALAAPSLDTWMTSGPTAITHATTATFSFESNYAATFECRLDAGVFVPCTSPVSYTALPDGVHSFAARAKDPLGNVDVVPASRSWMIDLTGPNAVALAQPPNDAVNLSAATTFSWSPTSDGVSGVDRYELWVDGTLSRTLSSGLCAAMCATTPLTALADGAHSWHVRAFDGVGNVSSSATRVFTVDAAAPVAFSLAAPQDDAATTDRRPVLSWHATTDAGIGLSGFDVLIDDTVVRSVGPSVTTFTPAGDLAEGTHSWQVVAKDAYGNTRASAVQRFTVDVTAPVAALIAAPNPTLAGRSVTLDGAGSSDAGSGIAGYAWDLDGDGVFARDTGATSSIAAVFADPGTHVVQLRVTDRAGLSAVARVDVRVTTSGTRDPLGITINSGARYTRSPNVTITATWPSFASQMLVSNDGGFGFGKVLPLAKSTSWTLDSSGAERSSRLVYVRFQRGLTTSETYIDDIILDERAPTLTTARVATVGQAGLLVRLKARDRGLAGVAGVQVTNNRRSPRAAFRPYRASVRLTRRKGERTLSLRTPIYVRVRDRAGNLSTWRTATRVPARAR